MEAYHLKTQEPDNLLDFETFTLNSIYVPSRQILIGLAGASKPNTYVTFNYSIKYCQRAQYIVEGNKNGVKGEVISRIDLQSDIVDKIASNKHRKLIKTVADYDGATDMLVKILSGDYRKKTLLKRISSYIRN